MKKNLTYLAIYTLMASLVLFSACKKDDGGDDPDPKADKIEDLSATWTVTSIVAGSENIDLTGVSTAITLTATQTYAITNFDGWVSLNLNHSNVLKASGTYDLNSTLDGIILDGVAANKLSIITISDSELKFSYASNYPKETSEAATITVTATK